MRALTLLRLGLRQTRRRPGPVAIAWLAAVVPALAVAALAAGTLGPALDTSPEAARVFSGGRFAVWIDLLASPRNHLGPIAGMLPLWFLGMVPVQALVSAGLVEALFGRLPRRERPFVAGVGRHGGRFLRSALWFALALAAVVGVAGASLAAVIGFADAGGRGEVALWGVLGIALLALLALVPLRLGYDLSRVAAAAWGEGATLRGFLRALGHALRHPAALAPVLVLFAGAGLLLQLGYLAVRHLMPPSGGAGLAVLFALQLVALLLHAALRVGLWGCEIAYYQAIGEPRFSRPRRR